MVHYHFLVASTSDGHLLVGSYSYCDFLWPPVSIPCMRMTLHVACGYKGCGNVVEVFMSDEGKNEAFTVLALHSYDKKWTDYVSL